MSSTVSPCCCGAWSCPEACLSEFWRGDAPQQQRLLQVESNRADMDLTSLREQYRRSQEKQRRHTQVVLFRRASTELSDSLSIIPVTQGLSQEQTNDLSTSGSLIFDPAMRTFDPWHTHLGLYRRACLLTAGVPVEPSHPPPTAAHLDKQWLYWPPPPQSRRSSSLSEAEEQEVLNTLTTDTSQKSSSEVSPCSSPNRTRGDGPVWSFNRSEGEAAADNHHSPGELSGDEATEDDVSSSTSGSKDTSITSSVHTWDESSTPVGSVSSSAIIRTQQAERNKSGIGRNNNQWGAGAPRKFSIPGPSLTKQPSLSEPHALPPGPSQDHHYYPFPQRKTPRKSEAARKLGMYASF